MADFVRHPRLLVHDGSRVFPVGRQRYDRTRGARRHSGCTHRIPNSRGPGVLFGSGRPARRHARHSVPAPGELDAFCQFEHAGSALGAVATGGRGAGQANGRDQPRRFSSNERLCAAHYHLLLYTFRSER